MKNAKLLLLSSALLFVGHARAQLNIPAAAISSAFPSISSVELQQGNDNSPWNAARPTPFLINNALIPGNSNDVADSLVWFCLDPHQVMYTGGSLVLNFASDDPADFNKWHPDAPGLNSVRIQDLADLFTAYMPSTLAGNQSLIGALQLAVWEIVNDYSGTFSNPTYSLTGGRFEVQSDGNNTTADNALIASAQAMLTSLSTVGIKDVGNTSYLDYLIDGTYTNDNCDVVKVQDLLGWSPPEFTPPIPEPSTYGLAAIGILLPLALRRMRSQKSKSVPAA